MYELLCSVVCLFCIYGIYSALREARAFFLRLSRTEEKCTGCTRCGGCTEAKRRE